MSLTFSVKAEESNKIGPFAYKVQDGATCSISLSPIPENAKSFPLDNPNRFVIDIPTKNISGKNSTDSITANCFTSLRLGLHKDYARIVIDLAQDYQLKNFTHNNQALILFFENNLDTPVEIKTDPVPVAATSTPTRTSTSTSIPLITKSVAATSTPTPSPTSTMISTATKGPNIQPTFTPTIVELNTPTPSPTNSPSVSPTKESSSQTTLNSILFDTSKDHVVNFTFSSSPQYSMLKKGPNLYWIIISNAKLGNQTLSKPYFASQDFKGIVSVLAKDDEQNLILEIRTEPQVQLFSFRDGFTLSIKKE